jgi:hypothetical protein
VRNARNFGIVALLALGVYALPGGDTAANLFGAILFVVVTVGIGLLGARYYMENRSEIYGLGDRWRLLLYGALGVVVLDMAATPKLFDTGGGTALWVLLLAGSLYALYAVFRHSREY